MEEITTFGLDLAKHVFHVHGSSAQGDVLLRKKLRCGQVLDFFSKHSPCVVAMEACSSAHYLAREIGSLGHEVRLIPPAYVKPFVKRQKNDTADAEAIAEAALRPTMHFVPVKSEEIQGAATLPAMTRLGYPKRLSAAVEAVASSGGQIMPPLMGAGAFVMVELTGIP